MLRSFCTSTIRSASSFFCASSSSICLRSASIAALSFSIPWMVIRFSSSKASWTCCNSALLRCFCTSTIRSASSFFRASSSSTVLRCCTISSIIVFRSLATETRRSLFSTLSFSTPSRNVSLSDLTCVSSSFSRRSFSYSSWRLFSSFLSAARSRSTRSISRFFSSSSSWLRLCSEPIRASLSATFFRNVSTSPRASFILLKLSVSTSLILAICNSNCCRSFSTSFALSTILCSLSYAGLVSAPCRIPRPT